MIPIAVIGMGISGKEGLPAAYLSMIDRADVLVGGKRHLESFDAFEGEKWTVSAALEKLTAAIRNRMETDRIVVLASGDPLFYGIAERLVRDLGEERVIVFPNVTAVAAAFSRIKMAWHDAQVVSLHGRNLPDNLIDRVENNTKTAFLTDPKKNPAWLAAHLLENGLSDGVFWVAERLGGDAEQVASYTLSEAAGRRFADPNVAVLVRRRTDPVRPARIALGMPDDVFAHKRGMITKPEVRSIAIAKLRLGPDHVLWDLGAGSGSISVEAALFITHGRIFAVEKNPERIADVQTNKKRFGVTRMQIVQAEMPDGLADLPAPDRVFIGGGGAALADIIRTAADRLRPNGIIVANTVVLATAVTAMETLQAAGFKTDIVQVQISVGRKMPQGERLEARNPVWIVSGEKR